MYALLTAVGTTTSDDEDWVEVALLIVRFAAELAEGDGACCLFTAALTLGPPTKKGRLAATANDSHKLHNMHCDDTASKQARPRKTQELITKESTSSKAYTHS